MSQSPEAVMRAFYDALFNKRFDEQESLYAPNVRFEDRVFAYPDRQGTMKMWRKLFGQSRGTFAFQFQRTEGETAFGHWTADYHLGKRPVHNEIDARMVIRDGKIVEHVDSFDWPTWAKQALPLGALGGTWLVNKLFSVAARRMVAKG